MAETRLRFTVISQVLGGSQFEFAGDRPITIGRTKDNTLALNHKSVSRRHARIEPNGDGWRVVDSESHNGVRVGDEIVAEHDLRSGDEVTFGEVTLRFTAIDGAEATPSDALPATIGDPTQTALPARPLALGDVFPEAAPTQPIAEPSEAGLGGALAYSLTLVGIIVVGLLAIWYVSQPTPRQPVVNVQLKAGATLPVNVSRYRRDAHGRRALFGLLRITGIGQPQHEHVAFARRSKFRHIVIVKGLAVGTTDIPLYGPPLGDLTLRVLVRDVKPDPPWKEWLNQPLPERVARAKDLIQRATNAMPKTGVVTANTTMAIRNFDLAVALIGSDPRYRGEANLAAQKATELKEKREKFFDTASRDLTVLEDQGAWQKVDARMQDLLRVFTDPEEEEYHVIRAEYERLLERIAYEQRKAEERR